MSEPSASGRTHRLRIGVLDNDQCALECIVAMVNQCPNVDVWACNKPAQAIQECRFGNQHTDIIIVDMALNGLTGAQVAAEIRRVSPGTGIIGVTSYSLESYELALVEAGAQALLDKSTLRATLPEAIEEVGRGRTYPANSRFAAVDAADVTTVPTDVRMTATERRVVALSAGSRTSRQIADELGVSVDTVFSHRRNIKKKFHANEWHEVIERCRQLHIL